MSRVITTWFFCYADVMEQSIKKLLRRYGKLERRISLLDGSDKYADLVTASANHKYPVQRWFHLKEAFSLDLLETLLADWRIQPHFISRVLDPFCGTGTSLLSAQKFARKTGRDDLQAFGFERNPFLHFVANTKVHWHQFNLQQFQSHAARILNGVHKPIPRRLPALSTLRRQDVYKRQTLKEILGFRGAIDSVEHIEKALLLLGYASVLEDLSGTRKDGRALRIVQGKQPLVTATSLNLAWSAIAEDARQAPNHFKPIHTKILLGDGRTLANEYTSGNELKEFDIVIYSPPYLNNIDYTEVYKIELWMCGFVDTASKFRSLRYQTFRSHPSVRFPDPITITEDEQLNDVTKTLEVLIEALPNDKDRQWRSDLFKGYFDDMYQGLKHQKNALRAGGWIFCIVGNSLHGPSDEPESRVPVASDLIIASIAQAIGLEVKAIQVARLLKRRAPDTHYLRESIIVMRKPH